VLRRNSEEHQMNLHGMKYSCFEENFSLIKCDNFMEVERRRKTKIYEILPGPS
jgi:hypothetical protein